MGNRWLERLRLSRCLKLESKICRSIRRQQCKVSTACSALRFDRPRRSGTGNPQMKSRFRRQTVPCCDRVVMIRLENAEVAAAMDLTMPCGGSILSAASQESNGKPRFFSVEPPMPARGTARAKERDVEKCEDTTHRFVADGSFRGAGILGCIYLGMRFGLYSRVFGVLLRLEKGRQSHSEGGFYT